MNRYWLNLLMLSSIVTCPLLAQDRASDNDFTVISDTIPGTKVAFTMAPIPGGDFLQGTPEAEPGRDPDEGPQHQVAIEPFWMGIHEVTFDEYHIFREKELDKAEPGEEDKWDADAVARPSPPYEDPTFGMGKQGFPAGSMTQFAALQYCKWLSDKTGEFYRLPTEAEWEYACRAGTSTTYYFGDNEEMLDDHAWHYDNSDEKYHPVGSKEPNPWGLFDMYGNVAEWTLDQYAKDFYGTLTADDPMANPWFQPTKLHPRTVRGGSFDDMKEEHRSGARMMSSMKWKERDPQIPKSFWWNTDSPFVGFRIIKPYRQPSKEEQEAFWALVLGG